MRIKGMRKYPQIIKSVNPTKHKYGADVTWSAHTDTYKPTFTGHGIDAEINAFKNNLQLTILISPSTDSGYEKEIKDVLETGRFDSGLYFRAFLDDYVTQHEWHKEVTGKYASYWSYGNGRRLHDDFVLENGLLTRNSASSSVSYDFDTRLHQRVATAFNYDVRDFGMSQAFTTTKEVLQKAISESGWYNDFSHWHWANVHGDKDQLEHFLGGQRELLNTVNSITLGSGEAVEYMWLRKQFKRGGLYQDGNELVLISDVWNEDDLPYQTISTSLSVEVDVTGTILEGKEIESSSELLKTGTNQFIVQVPYSFKDGFRTVRLRETLEPNYLDFALPIIKSTYYTNGELTVSTDKLTKAVLFSLPSGGHLYEAEIVERSNNQTREHKFELSDTSKEYYIGIMTKEKQSILSEKITF